jgi:uncharacterized protein with HEPN domain
MKPGTRDAANLYDMLEAAREAYDLVSRTQADTFLRDRVLQRALERMLELVGAAARRVTVKFQAGHPEIEWRGIIGQRNILAHEYGRIKHALLFQTAKEDAPSLISALEKILEDK